MSNPGIIDMLQAQRERTFRPAGTKVDHGQVWYFDSGTPIILTFADLLELDPPAYFSERQAMSRMGPVRLGLHLVLRTLYFAGAPRHAPLRPSLAVRAWWWLWRLERRSWPR